MRLQKLARVSRRVKDGIPRTRGKPNYRVYPNTQNFTVPPRERGSKSRRQRRASAAEQMMSRVGWFAPAASPLGIM
jgi:hypothetical protein